MKKIRNFILMAFLLFPIVVSAESFKDGDVYYVLEERKIECIDEYDAVFGILDDSIVFEDYDSSFNRIGFIKVNNQNKCEELTSDELIKLYSKKYNFFMIDYSDELKKDVLVEMNYSLVDYVYIKTKDTELNSTKSYHILNDDNVIEPISNPVLEDIDTYYEAIYVTKPSSSIKDENLIYYEKSLLNENVYVEVEDFNSEKVGFYFIEAGNLQDRKELDVLNISKEKFEELSQKYPDVYAQKGAEDDVYYIIFSNYTNGEYTSVVYDNNGKEIEVLRNSLAFDILNNSLYAVYYEDSFVLLNKEFKKIYESKMNLNAIDYNDYVYYFTGWDNNTNTSIYYNLYEYKTLEGINQTYQNEELKIKFSGLLERLKSVKVNDEELDKQFYSLESGSTIVTLKKEYLDTLKEGTYTLSVEYNDNAISKTQFKIKVDEENPQTLDNISLFFILASISFALLVGTTLYLKIKEN